MTFDEAHVVSNWGIGNFRPDYGKLAEILSQVSNPATLITTATMTDAMLKKTLEVLWVDEPHIIAGSPDRLEIFISFEEANFEWLFNLLEREKGQTPKTLIYCRSALECGKVLGLFLHHFESDLFSAKEKKPCNRMIAIFSSSISATGKQSILERFTNDTDLRIVIATDAFGMGIDIRDIRCVVIHGLPESYNHLWQQIGRASRDGGSGRAVIHKKQTRMRIEDNVRQFFCTIINSCIREEIVQNVSLKQTKFVHKTSTICKKCSCCSFCKSVCDSCMEITD